MQLTEDFTRVTSEPSGLITTEMFQNLRDVARSGRCTDCTVSVSVFVSSFACIVAMEKKKAFSFTRVETRGTCNVDLKVQTTN